MKKYLNKKLIFPIVAVLVVILLASLPFILEANKEKESEASILSAKAEITDISRTVSGTGILTPEEGSNIKLPNGVEITRYLVSNGDMVTEGTPLANVDKTTVLVAISKVQDSMKTVEEDMVKCAEDTADDKIYTGAPGIIKVIYAKEGDDVKKVMAEYGCLARVSLDGNMAVAIYASGLRVGESVDVTLSDGTVLPGKVDTCAGGRMVIVLTDRGTEYGDLVTVSKNGQILGTSELYVHSEFKATAYTGTVSHVYFNVEDSVLSGAALFYLQNVENSAQYELYASQHRDYEDIMERLFKMLNDGYISAPCDGAVSGIDEDEAKELERKAKTIRANGTAFMQIGSQIDQTWANFYTTVESMGNQLKQGLDDNTETVYATLVWCDNVNNPTLLRFAYFTNTGDVNYITINSTVEGFYDLTAKKLIVGSTSAQITIQYEKPTSIKAAGGNIPSGGGQGQQGQGQQGQGQQGQGQQGQGQQGQGTGTYITGVSDSNYYSTYEDVIMTVTPQTEMTVTITIDELDILKLSIGQEARVTVDALPGTSFDGIVTTINKTAENSGGNSKFTAIVTLKREDKMLDGMNATALINVAEYPGVLGIPVSALYDEGTKSMVYTAYDKKRDELVNPVEVETGVSDGETVEILSGIEEGTQVWYEYYDKVEINFKPK